MDTRARQCVIKQHAAVGAIPFVSRVDGCVARQQQLDDVNVTFRGGQV
jgi:hypothetical protein